jgi:hypothetical protein
MLLAPFYLSLPSSANETFVDIAVSPKKRDKADTTKIHENQLILLGRVNYVPRFFSLNELPDSKPSSAHVKFLC